MVPRKRMFALIPAAFFASGLVGSALADSTTLYVENKTSGYITVNVDGNYGCNTSSGSTCSIPVSTGSHDLTATRSDTGDSTATTKDCGSNGCTWVPWTN